MLESDMQMGVLRFLSTLQQFFPACVQSAQKGKQKHYETVYVDFNGFVHDACSYVCKELNQIARQLPRNLPKQPILITLPDGQQIDFSDLARNVDNSTADWRVSAANQCIEPRKNAYIISKAIALLEHYLKTSCGFLYDHSQGEQDQKMKLLYIAIDGVPDRAKMTEQRHRKCAGAILTEVGKRLSQKLGRQQWTSWNKNNIMPFSSFMRQLEEALVSWSANFEQNTRVKCTVDPATNPGEGETKILNHIKAYPNTTHLLLLSPDADSIIQMIPVATSRPVDILRKTNQDSELCLLSVNELNNYLLQGLDLAEIHTSSYLQSLSFAFILLGNDYVPQLPSLSQGRGLTLVSRLHQQVVCESSALLDAGGSIQFQEFVRLLSLIAEHEDDFLKNKCDPDIQDIKRAFSISNVHTPAGKHKAKMQFQEFLKQYKDCSAHKDEQFYKTACALATPHIYYRSADCMKDLMTQNRPPTIKQKTYTLFKSGDHQSAPQDLDVHEQALHDLENMQGKFSRVCESGSLSFANRELYYKDCVGGCPDDACEWYVRGLVYALQQQVGGHQLESYDQYAYPYKRAPFACDILRLCQARGQQWFEELTKQTLKTHLSRPSCIEHAILTIPMTADNLGLFDASTRDAIQSILLQQPTMLTNPADILQISDALFELWNSSDASQCKNQLIDGRDRFYLSRAFFKFMVNSTDHTQLRTALAQKIQ